VRRENAPPPIATTLFYLTPCGAALEAALILLGNWGAPLLAKASKKDAFRGHWLALPARHWLKDHSPERPPVRIELRVGGEAVSIETLDGGVRTRGGAVERPDAVITGKAQQIAALLAGKMSLVEACGAGVTYEGDTEALHRVQPLAV
jgi:hypothetical protein